jgi:hypothetical protein
LHKKQEGAEQLRLPIESLAQVLIGRVNLQALIHRNKDGAYNDKGEWLPKIILDKTYAALIGLAWHGKKGDRPRLGREDRQSNRGPLNTRIALEILT